AVYGHGALDVTGYVVLYVSSLAGSLRTWISFFFHAEDGIRARNVTGVQTCALPICLSCAWGRARWSATAGWCGGGPGWATYLVEALVWWDVGKGRSVLTKIGGCSRYTLPGPGVGGGARSCRGGLHPWPGSRAVSKCVTRTTSSSPSWSKISAVLPRGRVAPRVVRTGMEMAAPPAVVISACPKLSVASPIRITQVRPTSSCLES